MDEISNSDPRDILRNIPLFVRQAQRISYESIALSVEIMELIPIGAASDSGGFR